MTRTNRRKFLQALSAVAAVSIMPDDHVHGEETVPAPAPVTIDKNALPIVARHSIVTLSPPTQIPRAVVTDALFIGNGDLLAAFAGTPKEPQYWLTTNDFWEMREWGGPRPLGRIIFDMPDLAGATYRAEQDMASAKLTSTFVADATTVTMTSWVAAAENLFIAELTCTGSPVDGNILFLFPDETGHGSAATDNWNYSGGAVDRLNHLPTQQKAWKDGIVSADRVFSIGTDQATRLCLAGMLINGGTDLDGSFTIQPGAPVLFAAAVKSACKNSRPLDTAIFRVSTLDAPQIEEIRMQHQDWWEKYWNVSLVEIDDPTIERQYYRSHYNMGVFSRDPDHPPCDYGICTSDDPVCCADYKIDYNYQAGMLGLNVAGRFEQTVCYDSPGIAHLPRACADSMSLLGHNGAYMSLGLGPRGMVPEHIWLGMKSQNAFFLVNTAERWYLTRDFEYAKKVYQMVREVARFWEQDLKWDGHSYPVADDSGQEWTGHHCLNTCAGVAFIQLAMRLMLDMSEALSLDTPTRPLWKHILDNVGPLPIRDAGTLHTLFDSPEMDLQDVFPKGVLPGKEIIAFEGVGIDYSFECAIQTFPIYPCGQIGLDSNPKLLSAARNTLELRVMSEAHYKSWPGPKPSGIDGGAWFDGNHGCLFFVSAIRIGHDPREIWEKLIEWCTDHVYLNGFRNDANDGLENYGAIPNAIHEMMMLSHENILRVFRVWPRQEAPNARFANLWATGAFRVSSELKNGHIAYVHLVSEKGRTCTVENPWQGKAIKLASSLQPTTVHTGERIKFATTPGEVIWLTET